ncbi:hypothetical protein GWK47_022752 [Chionoecetes opilio]|uniref:Uncharacterized protein n=1 Tax=Chionoecetes opilio TaxID=41210 RepID=A0A8J4XWP8_CHIOP|nr:hypothetical protein GWK47_022752 [Chionoecetes opilio]
MAMDYRSSMMNDDEIVGHLKNVANLLREEMLQQRSWSFTGSFSNFENPSLLQFFMSHLLFGSHVVKVSGIRDQEVDKTVDVSCQFLVQNTRTDRQVKHQTKKDSAGCKTQVANALAPHLCSIMKKRCFCCVEKEVLCGMREQKMSWHRRNLIYHIGATCPCRSPDNQLYQPKDSLLAELITGLRDIRVKAGGPAKVECEGLEGKGLQVEMKKVKDTA